MLDFLLDDLFNISCDNTIFSDDPQAVVKLSQKIDKLKKVQEFTKAANQCIRKQDEAAFLALPYGTPELWAKLNISDRVHGKVFPFYELTNNSANIRRLEQRLAGLQKQSTKKSTDETINGVRIYENAEANRLQLFFPDKPDEDSRKKLKANGFRWSPRERAWQRHISNYALYSAESIIRFIETKN